MHTKPEEFARKTGWIMNTARKRRALTQRQMAASLGVSQSTLSRFETGKRILSAAQWYLFCQKAGISPNILCQVADTKKILKISMLTSAASLSRHNKH